MTTKPLTDNVRDIVTRLGILINEGKVRKTNLEGKTNQEGGWQYSADDLAEEIKSLVAEISKEEGKTVSGSKFAVHVFLIVWIIGHQVLCDPFHQRCNHHEPYKEPYPNSSTWVANPQARWTYTIGITLTTTVSSDILRNHTCRTVNATRAMMWSFTIKCIYRGMQRESIIFLLDGFRAVLGRLGCCSIRWRSLHHYDEVSIQS